MYTVYGNVFTRAMRVLWCLEEIGLDYTHVPASPQSPEILAVNPAGKLPAMSLDDGTVLTDSTAIMTYLADKHDAVTYPAGTVERARQDGITHKLSRGPPGRIGRAAGETLGPGAGLGGRNLGCAAGTTDRADAGATIARGAGKAERRAAQIR